MELISSLNLDLDILYIADTSLRYPPAHESVDVNVDFFSHDEHDFYFKGRYYDSMEPYMKKDALVAGITFDMDANAKSRKLFSQKYPEGTPEKLKFFRVRENLEELGYQVESKGMGAVYETRNQYSFSCHISKEELRFVYFTGKRGSFRG